MISTDNRDMSSCNFLREGEVVADYECTTTLSMESDHEGVLSSDYQRSRSSLPSLMRSIAVPLTVISTLVECAAGEKTSWCNLKSAICNMMQASNILYGAPINGNQTNFICDVLLSVGINSGSNCSLPLLYSDYNHSDDRLRVGANTININVSRMVFPNESDTSIEELNPALVKSFGIVLSGHDCNISIIEHCNNLSRYMLDPVTKSSFGETEPPSLHIVPSGSPISTTLGEVVNSTVMESTTAEVPTTKSVVSTISATLGEILNSTAVSSTTTETPTTKSGIKPSLIVAIVCGVCLGLFVLATLILPICRNKRRGKKINIHRRNNEVTTSYWIEDKYRRLHQSNML
ncbi:hypothetical protein [Candidatus Ichthyocystis hellenicum]|uniref:hypothetical protein n=1 Tax=Candidatus Ichthyocystis hellenicum TaxID=1561003 RepID=UPI000B84AE96|nr:hypothetical protein [Candidatus Ichthyocystis hellenicum]